MEDGYVVEVRIPFKSLRFKETPEQSWGLHVFRKVQRLGFSDSWAPVTGNLANGLAQAGTLDGLRQLDPGPFLKVNPFVTGRRVGLVNAAGAFERDDAEGDLGFNLTYGLTSNLTLDATYNPDFSQIEADAGQIAVNERFALFFPEKRPFFLEGSETFSLPQQIVYTRSIVSPIAGAKITGKVGNFTLGYLGALDRPTEGEDATVNVVRVRKDVGGSSTLGLVYTDRTHSGDDYNRVAGADARLVFGSRYSLSLLGALSRTEAGSQPLDGSLLAASFNRAGRTLALEFQVEDIAPDFPAGSGFIQRIGETHINGNFSLAWYGSPGATVERVSPYTNVEGYWDHDAFWAGGGPRELDVEVGLPFSLRNNISLGARLSLSRFDFPDERYSGLFAQDPRGDLHPFRPSGHPFDGLRTARFYFFFSNWQRVRGRVGYNWAETPIFDRSLGVPIEVGKLVGGLPQPGPLPDPGPEG